MKLIFSEVKLIFFGLHPADLDKQLYTLFYAGHIRQKLLFCFVLVWLFVRAANMYPTQSTHAFMCCFVFPCSLRHVHYLNGVSCVVGRLPYNSMHSYSSHKLASSNSASCMLLSPIAMATGTIDSPERLLHHILESTTAHSSACATIVASYL